ncbi:MAG: WXG100 family type VII secretion target [Bifidobacteriaceae bacterium]|jgi:WXG100 family type VII secretion target|nr:WXG100 family type VII secretion target [Bifidobacteriaceae bacterium]
MTLIRYDIPEMCLAADALRADAVAIAMDQADMNIHLVIMDGEWQGDAKVAAMKKFRQWNTGMNAQVAALRDRADKLTDTATAYGDIEAWAIQHMSELQG